MNEVKYKTLAECKAAMETVKSMGVPVPEWLQRQYDDFQKKLNNKVKEELHFHDLSERYLTDDEMKQLREEVECWMNGGAVLDGVLSNPEIHNRKYDSRYNRFKADSITVNGKVIYAADEGGRRAKEREEVL